MAIQLKKGFVLRKIGAQYMAVPFGAMTSEVKGMISLTETGFFLWKAMEEGKNTVDALADALTAEKEAIAADAADKAAAIEKLNAEVATAAETAKAQESAIAALEKEGEALNAKKTAAEEALAKAEADKAGLEAQVAAMTTELAAMQEAMVALAAEEPVAP